MRQRDIVRFWFVFALLLATALAAITVAKRWHRIFPPDEVSSLYSRYAGVEGLDVSFVKGYRVNDTLRVDVTLLDATTDSAWTLIQKEFGIKPLPPELMSWTSKDEIAVRYAPRSDYSQPTDPIPENNDVIAISWFHTEISVFHTQSADQQRAVSSHQHDESIKHQNDNPKKQQL